MTRKHLAFGAQVPSSRHLLADELERMAFERRKQELALRTQMHRSGAFPSPVQATPDAILQGVGIEPALNSETESTGSEVSASLTPIPPVNTESVEKPFVANVRPLRQSLEEAYAKAEMNAHLEKEHRNVGTDREEPPKSWRHPDNRPEWEGLKKLGAGAVKFGEGFGSGVWAVPGLVSHAFDVALGDPQAKMVNRFVDAGIQYGTDNAAESVDRIIEYLKNNKTYTAGRAAGSFAVGPFYTKGTLKGINKISKALNLTKNQRIAAIIGTFGAMGAGNFTLSQLSGAVDSVDSMVDQMKDSGHSIMDLPPEVAANIVFAGGAGLDVKFDPKTGAITTEIETDEGIERLRLDDI